MDTSIGENKAQIISMEKSLLKKVKSQDCRMRINALEKFSFSDSRGDFPDDQLHLNFKNVNDEKLACSLNSQKFYDINAIYLFVDTSKNKHLTDFLTSCFPNKTNYLGAWTSHCTKLDRSNYFNLLVSHNSKVVRRVEFNRVKLSFRCLKRLIAAYRHVRVLTLSNLKLSIPSVPDFSKALTNCQIKTLILRYSGWSDCSNCRNNRDQFKNLIKGLASSPDLRLSLRMVDIHYCGIYQNDAEEIFTENQLGNVKIIGGE
ncbi:unnamed protein product [Moneuplotes crassus]|uniref:Uncharacterized protein n=1 Tax=Euplotes crassus TaxID=5936 RepID=A0AAD1UR13_EUPCR|nr:unnamed protein product [Moneuplotes crassus]